MMIHSDLHTTIERVTHNLVSVGSIPPEALLPLLK